MTGPVPQPADDREPDGIDWDKPDSALLHGLQTLYGDAQAWAGYELVKPILAQLRAEVADWVPVAKSALGEITEAHTRNAVLRDEHRKELDDLRAQLVAIGAQRDDAEEERATMVRDLNAALFDGSTLLPDRPLDTVWEYLLGLVREDAASRSGRGEVPDDAAVDRVAKYLLSLQQAGGVSPEEIDQLWTEGLNDFSRDLWRGRARVLLGLLAESAVTNPTDGASALGWRSILANCAQNIATTNTSSASGQLQADLENFAVAYGAYGLEDPPAGPVVPAPTEDTGPAAEVDVKAAIRVARDAVKAEALRGAGGFIIAATAVQALAAAGMLRPAPPAVSEEERAQDDADRAQADALRPAPAVRPADLFERADGLDGRYVCVCGDRIPDREHHWRGSWICLPRDHSAQPPVAPVTAQPEETRDA